MKFSCYACTIALALAAVVCAVFPQSVSAEEGDRTISLADGQLELAAPEGWERKQPRTRIVEHEFAIPAAEGDEDAGRMTIMGAGGSVADNIKRWEAQFEPGEDGEEVKAEIKKSTIDGVEVQVVDLAGTYRDMPAGPFAGGKTIRRENYRMLAAILVSGDQNIGNYFVKFYGPAATVEANADAFQQMVDSLKKK